MSGSGTACLAKGRGVGSSSSQPVATGPLATISSLLKSPIGSIRSVLFALCRKEIDPAEGTRIIGIRELLRLPAFERVELLPNAPVEYGPPGVEIAGVEPRRDSAEPGLGLGLGGSLAVSVVALSAPVSGIGCGAWAFPYPSAKLFPISHDPDPDPRLPLLALGCRGPA